MDTIYISISNLDNKRLEELIQTNHFSQEQIDEILVYINQHNYIEGLKILTKYKTPSQFYINRCLTTSLYNNFLLMSIELIKYASLEKLNNILINEEKYNKQIIYQIKKKLIK